MHQDDKQTDRSGDQVSDVDASFGINDRKCYTAWFRMARREALAIVLSLAAFSVCLTIWAMANYGAGAVVVSHEQENTISVATELMDINSAQWYELSLLPGIGPKRARRIVAYRTANGPFKDVSELAGIKGIGPVTVEKLRPFVKLGRTE